MDDKASLSKAIVTAPMRSFDSEKFFQDRIHKNKGMYFLECLFCKSRNHGASLVGSGEIIRDLDSEAKATISRTAISSGFRSPSFIYHLV